MLASGCRFHRSEVRITHFLVLLLALLIGVVAGLRALTAPAVVAWAAMLDWINLDGTWAEWLGHPITVAVLTVLAVGELITDKLPKTPSRKTPMQFFARLATGGFAGSAIGTAWGYTWSAPCSAHWAEPRPAGGWLRPTTGLTCRLRWSRMPSPCSSAWPSRR